MRTKRVALTLLGVVLIGLPLLFDSWLAAKIAHYSEVDLKYECHYEKSACEADFNNNGTIDPLVRDQTTTPAPNFDSWLVITDGSSELLRLPCRYIDNTLKTHIAAQKSSAGGARLLVFDGVQQNNIPTSIIKTVFAWDGQRMVEVPLSDNDKEILSAMAAHDDAGTFAYWSLYTVFRWPVLIVYGLLLIVGAMLCRRFLYTKAQLS